MAKRQETPVERVKRRIIERLDEDSDKPLAFRRTQTALAIHLGITKSTLHEMLNGERATQGALARLDGIAEYLDMTPAELVKASDSALMELALDEQRVIRQWREWPKIIRANISALFDFFGELLPEEREQREYAMLLRQLREPVRSRVVEIRDSTFISWTFLEVR